MEHKFEIMTTAAQPVLSIRKTTSAAQLPQEIEAAIHGVIDYLQKLGQEPVDAPFACYYNMDMENLDVEIGFPVAAVIPGEGPLRASEIPAGMKAAALHLGTYQSMRATYESLTRWVKDNGYEPTGIVYEMYYNSPGEVPDSQLLTKIVFLLK